jgi:hypothetical protein
LHFVPFATIELVALFFFAIALFALAYTESAASPPKRWNAGAKRFGVGR